MDKIAKKLQKIQLTIGVLCLTVFLISVLIQVFSRIFGKSIPWTEDVCLYPFIWAVFMGASAMIYEKAHFRFDFLEKKLEAMNVRSAACLEIFINVLLLLFNVMMVYYGIRAVIRFWNFNWVTLPKMKMGYTWMILPIAGACSIFYLCQQLLGSIKKFQRGGEQE